MPKSKNTDNITLRVGVFRSLLERHKIELRDHPTQTKEAFSGFVNDILQQFIEKEAFLRIAYPTLSTIAVSEDALYIKDKDTENGKVGVYLKKGRLYCENDDSNSCDHVAFALCIPEVAKLKLRKPLLTTIK